MFDIYLPMILDLFSGEGAAAPAAAGAQGETQASPAPTRPGKKAGEFDNVVFGKQPGAQGAQAGDAQQPSDAGKATTIQTTSDAAEAKRAEWRRMVEGDYKDLFAQDTQRIINQRFRETKDLQARVDGMQPVIDALAQRYGESDPAKLAEKLNNDTRYWSEAADEAGMPVEQYKEMKRMERENAALREAQRRAQGQQQAQQQLQAWYSEAETLKGKYPGFDLQTEVQNPDFVRLLRSGTSVEHAYKVIHMDEMMTDAMSTAVSRTEQRVTENIRARGARPAEAGATAQGGFTVKDDVHQLTKADRAEIARRAARGETIRF